MKQILLILAALGLSLSTVVPTALAGDETAKAFVKKRYSIEGTARVIQKGGKTQLIFSDDFKTKNGPDLKVYLTKKPVAQLTGDDVATEAFKLGVLKSNKGGQSYILPADMKIDDYQSVVIHCEAFTVLWGGFDL